jgi:16S rRNA (guanine1207-N2)-methyltransferase
VDAGRADPYFRKRITFSHKGIDLEFDVAQTLFSGHEIDQGSALLLRSLVVESPARVLDLGCGYGVLGITLARLFPASAVTMLDSNLLAVRYARRNCELNTVSNAQAIGSVGLELAPAGEFDLIVSNIPGKIGDEAIEREFILSPIERLAPGGAMWFVVVSGLNRLIPKIATRNGLRVHEVRKRSGHTVYRLEKSPASN